MESANPSPMSHTYIHPPEKRLCDSTKLASGKGNTLLRGVMGFSSTREGKRHAVCGMPTHFHAFCYKIQLPHLFMPHIWILGPFKKGNSTSLSEFIFRNDTKYRKIKTIILCSSTVDLFTFQCLGIWFDISKIRIILFFSFLKKNRVPISMLFRILLLITSMIIITMVKWHNFASSRSLFFCIFVDVHTFRLNLLLVSKIKNLITLTF